MLMSEPHTNGVTGLVPGPLKCLLPVESGEHRTAKVLPRVPGSHSVLTGIQKVCFTTQQRTRACHQR